MSLSHQSVRTVRSYQHIHPYQPLDRQNQVWELGPFDLTPRRLSCFPSLLSYKYRSFYSSRLTGSIPFSYVLFLPAHLLFSVLLIRIYVNKESTMGASCPSVCSHFYSLHPSDRSGSILKGRTYWIWLFHRFDLVPKSPSSPS